MSRIFLPLIAFFLLFTTIVNAADDVDYLIENIAISVEGDSPSDARDLAFRDARRNAFIELLLHLNIANINLDEISDEEITHMVMSEQIDKEKIAGNRYSAVFTIIFGQDFVEHTLSQKNLYNKNKNADHMGEKSIIFPVKIINHQAHLWESDNNWAEAIRNAIENNQDNAKEKLVVPHADIENISTINRNNVTTASYNLFGPLLPKYGANTIYTLLFSHDTKSNKVSIDIFHIRKFQRKQYRLKFINTNKMAKDELLNKIAGKTVEYLISSQKFEAKDKSSDLARIKIPLDDLEEWVEIQNKIENSGFIDKIIVESVSRDEAMVLINYLYSEPEMIASFARIGFELRKKSDNYYILLD